jgi:hypothetical protein
VLLACAWALGWGVTAAVGVRIEDGWTVFGSTGALVVTALTAVLPLALRRAASRGRWRRGDVSWYERGSAAAAVPAHADGAADACQVQRHAQEARGDEHGGGDHRKAEVEQLEEQCESEQDSGDDRSHDAYLST